MVPEVVVHASNSDCGTGTSSVHGVAKFGGSTCGGGQDEYRFRRSPKHRPSSVPFSALSSQDMPAYSAASSFANAMPVTRMSLPL
jgi:hypothetical protein